MCGRVDVDGLLSEMSPELFNEWIAYYYCEPFGDDWARTAQLSAIICNLLVSDKKDLTEPEDYYPKFGSEAKANKRKGYMSVQDFAAMAAKVYR